MQQKSDSEIEQWVLREFRLRNEIKSKELCVCCSNGVATLKGTVKSHGEKLAVQKAAERVAGIVGVINGIVVEQRIDLELIARSRIAVAATNVVSLHD